jgi:hypothetical protein
MLITVNLMILGLAGKGKDHEGGAAGAVKSFS